MTIIYISRIKTFIHTSTHSNTDIYKVYPSHKQNKDCHQQHKIKICMHAIPPYSIHIHFNMSTTLPSSLHLLSNSQSLSSDIYPNQSFSLHYFFLFRTVLLDFLWPSMREFSLKTSDMMLLSSSSFTVCLYFNIKS